MVGCSPEWLCVSIGLILAVLGIFGFILAFGIIWKANILDWASWVASLGLIFVFVAFMIAAYQMLYPWMLAPSAFTEAIP